MERSAGVIQHVSSDSSYSRALTRTCIHVNRCGSTTHRKITHRDCPLNPKRTATQRTATQETQVDTDSDSDVPLSEKFPDARPAAAPKPAAAPEPDAAPEPFPYPLGTMVAVQFDAGIFVGNITKLYPGEDSCMVTFTDGDKQDYDAGQIQYAMQLYEREFPPEE